MVCRNIHTMDREDFDDLTLLGDSSQDITRYLVKRDELNIER